MRYKDYLKQKTIVGLKKCGAMILGFVGIVTFLTSSMGLGAVMCIAGGALYLSAEYTDGGIAWKRENSGHRVYRYEGRFH